MWEKETLFQLKLKKNLIYEHCKSIYDSKFNGNFNFDTVFITKEKNEIQAHRIILIVNKCNLMKQLDTDDCTKIILPDYSSDVVNAFIEFLYSGEVLIDLSHKEDFLSLCEHMMLKIPIDDNISDEQNLTEEETIVTEELADDVNEFYNLIESSEIYEPSTSSDINITESDNVHESHDQPTTSDLGRGTYHASLQTTYLSSLPTEHSSEIKPVRFKRKHAEPEDENLSKSSISVAKLPIDKRKGEGTTTNQPGHNMQGQGRWTKRVKN